LIPLEKSIIILPGQYFDIESGLHYNYHRYYDPYLGRYITPDPIGLTGGINLFAYADLDPINLVDPDGLKPGDFFKSIDTAARDAMNYIYAKSVVQDKEYGGTIYQTPHGYTYDEPSKGKRKGVTIPIPKGSVAWFHSHGDFSLGDYIDDTFSPKDIHITNYYKIPGYLVTPDKIMLKVYLPLPSNSIINETIVKQMEAEKGKTDACEQ